MVTDHREPRPVLHGRGAPLRGVVTVREVLLSWLTGTTFKALVFSGSPADYRQFRRKILLHVASLVRLAGPKILTRLSGEAWKATEHLSVGDLRSEGG